MRFSTLSLSLLLPALSAAAPACGNPSPKAAAYFLDNNPAGSSIVALAIGSDGKLSDPVRTSTGGKGLFGLTAGTNGAAAMAGGADTLFSQDSVVVSGEYLLTVNAGSNTVSLFTIPKDDILHPKLACSPVSTLGEFPQSIAYSPLHKTACVLNGGTVAGITCYSVSSSGLKTLGGLRPISLNETTPPVGPAGTVSDIIFNPSQTALIATVKGNGMDAGFIYAYPVSWGGSIATKPIVSRPSELAVDFSISFLGSDSRAIVTDPSYGASIVEVNSQYEFSVQKKIPVAGEKAICWSVYSRGYDTVFIFDGGLTGITMIDPWSGAIKGTIPGAAETVANLDAQTWKQYMYVLNGAAYVSVVDNSALARGETPSEVQNFDLSSLGSRQGFQGMAVYPSGEGW